MDLNLFIVWGHYKKIASVNILFHIFGKYINMFMLRTVPGVELLVGEFILMYSVGQGLR